MQRRAANHCPDPGHGTPVELIVDGDSLYWVMDENREVAGFEATRAVWRGNKDGTGEAEKLVDVIGWVQSLAAHGDNLYWMTSCRLEPERHFVRIATR